MRIETPQKLFRASERFLRIWVIALTVFALGYTPIHLSLEPHANGEVVEAADHEHEGVDHHEDDDHAEHNDAHAHHHENEHSVGAILPGKIKIDAFLLCLVIVASPSFSCELSDSFLVFTPQEEEFPEASSPPPLQPRAPPVC